VLAQSYENLEYILVNNHSDDGSREIAAEYTAKDSRVRLIDNTTFLTQVQNYNGALLHISGDSRYTKIVQADDWLFPSCLEQMVQLAEHHPRIGLVSAYCLNGNVPFLVGLPISEPVLSGQDVWRRFLLKDLYVFGTPTSHLFRSDIVRARQPFYDESSPIEDAEACFDILAGHDFGFVHQILTYTRRENDSLSTSINTFFPMTLLKLIELNKLGPKCLSPTELRACRKRIKRQYLRLLGESVLRRRPKPFWEFHQKGMKELGFHPSHLQICWNAFLVAVDLALNPKSTVERIITKARSHE
jgi:glycosyltransferase involved in cell wall biosynthesis